MNRITDIKLTQDDTGDWLVEVTKGFAPENGGGSQTFSGFTGDNIHGALDVAREMVTLTPGQRTNYPTATPEAATATAATPTATAKADTATAPTFYCTTYCNRAHEIKTGRPIDHECHVVPPAALRLEMEDRIPDAIAAIQAAKPLRTHRGVKGASHV